MSAEHDKSDYAREITLPSGRQIQVLYYEPEAPRSDDDLGLCGTCKCTLMQPISTEEVGKTHWQLTLRCPNCLWVGSGIFTEEALEHFEQKRIREIDLVRRELQQLSLDNMAEETERFVRALLGNQILPSDF